MSGRSSQKPSNEPEISNRKARHDFTIIETLECGMRLTGTEIKSIRAGQASLAEGYVRAQADPPRLTLHSVHIAEYPPAGPHRQHEPTRTRALLAHRREIRKFADRANQRGFTLVPLKIYFVRGVAKLLVGVAQGKGRSDKRQSISAREARRDIERALGRGRGR
jgi:SsrA-binding protein